MAVAVRLGVSLKRLGGWEPRESTVHEYGAGGVLLRSVTTREPEWDAEEVDMRRAYDALLADTGTHGHSMARATSEAANPNNYGSSLRYVGHGPFTDYAEKAKQDHIDAYKAQAGDNANLNGVYFTVEEVGG